MQVTVSRTSPVEVEVKVSLPREQVSSALAKAYTNLSKSAQIRGFRKGKVPMPLLKQYFGTRVTAQVWGELVDASLPKALEEHKLEPVTQPDVKPEGMPAENEDLTYVAKLEVRPQVENVVTDGIELKRTVYPVTDKDVEHQIEHLQDEHADLRTPDPARPVKKGDFVTLNYEVSIDGQPREDMNVQNRTVEIGKGRLLDELEAGIPGMNAGETKEITVSFPDTHAREDLRGKTAVLKVTAGEVREKVLPAIDDEFAKDVGSESLAALRTKIRTDLEEQGKQVTESQLREDAVTALVEKNPIAVPPSLVNNAVSIIARDLAQQMRYTGGDFDPAKIIETAKQQSEQRVRAGLLLGELARKNNLTVTDADVNARIEEMAKASGKAAARIRAENRDPKKRDALANAILEDKVLGLLLSKVKITEVVSDKPLHDHDH